MYVSQHGVLLNSLMHDVCACVIQGYVDFHALTAKIEMMVTHGGCSHAARPLKVDTWRATRCDVMQIDDVCDICA